MVWTDTISVYGISLYVITINVVTLYGIVIAFRKESR